MKTFFSSTFIKQEALDEARVSYPIKVEYYKIIHQEEKLKQEKAKFGIYILKKEYKKEGVNKEDEEIQYVTNDEKQIEEMLANLERNQVTPIGLKDVFPTLKYKK